MTAAVIPLALGLDVPTENVGNTFSFTLTSNHAIGGVALDDVRIRRLNPLTSYNPDTHAEITASVSAVTGTNNWLFDISFASSVNFDDAFIIRLRANQLTYDGGTVPSSRIDSAQFHIDSSIGANTAPAFANAFYTFTDVPIAVGEIVGTVTATDADNDTLTYSLEGTDATDFAIDANGQITVAVELTHSQLYAFNVVADDGTDTTNVGVFATAIAALSFGSQTIANQSWEVGATESLTLPAATGGNGTITYSLSPTLPAGISFNASSRVLSGNPTSTFSSATFTYTATDGDGTTVELTFSIVVAAPVALSFGAETIGEPSVDGRDRRKFEATRGYRRGGDNYL